MGREVTGPRARALLLPAALAACGTEPSGTLTLTVDALPPVTRETSIVVAGTVTRTPAKATAIIVTVAGGAAAAADTTAATRYEVRVTLNPNAANALTVSATDATGSSSAPAAASIRQDNQAPTVTQVTPVNASDDVAGTTTVELRLSEPVVLVPGGGVRLSRQGALLSGATTRSADSLTLTYTSSVPLSPNAVIHVTLGGVNDVAGNAVAATFASCFATALTGATASVVYPDSSIPDRVETELLAGTPPLPPDIVTVRFAREGSLFSGVIRFAGPRTFSLTAPDHATALLDLDTDQDSTTGFITFKDSIFKASAALGDSFSSGTGAEFLVGLEPLAALGDSAYVGEYVDYLTFQPLATFLPGMCGPMMGFVLPMSIFGATEDGLMNALLVGLAENAAQFMVDPVPIRRHLPLALPAASPLPPVSLAPYVTPAGGRTIRRDRPPRPLR
jgi:hypothetical protein